MKEKSIAVGTRDRQLLSILLAVVILFVMYMFLANPAYEESKLIKDEIAITQSTLQSMNATIEQSSQWKQEISQKRSELQEKYQVFLYAINEARILHQIDGIIIATGLTSNSYQQSGKLISSVSVVQSGYQPNAYSLLDLARKLNPAMHQDDFETTKEATKQPTDESVVATTVEQMDITIGFGNIGYPVLYNFIQAMEGLERSYVLSSISIGKGQQTTELQGQMLLKAISLPKINEEDASDLQFQTTVPQGKVSPF